MSDKSLLRSQYLKVRAMICDKEKAEKSKTITGKLLSTDEYSSAKCVFVYVSTKNEVSTFDMIERMLADGKRVAVPLCDIKTHTMSAVEIKSISELLPGAYSILEPVCKTQTISKDEIDLAIVPGVAFDRQGNRLGMGGGYYDRFLDGFCGISVGIVYSDCLTEALPVCLHDKKVDMVITDI